MPAPKKNKEAVKVDPLINNISVGEMDLIRELDRGTISKIRMIRETIFPGSKIIHYRNTDECLVNKKSSNH